MIVKLTVELIVDTGDDVVPHDRVGFKSYGLIAVQAGKAFDSTPREHWHIEIGKLIKSEEIPADWYLTY